MNIYNYIDINYAHEPELENLLPKDMLTDFLQRKAWSGLKDRDLRLVWRDVYAYILANLQTGQIVFQNRNLDALRNIVAWLDSYALDFAMTPEHLHKFLSTVKELHEYLAHERYIMIQYIDFLKLYDEFIDADGNISITEGTEHTDKVLHIDFKSKCLQKREFEPISLVNNKQLIYIREHIVDFAPRVFEAISYYKYTLTSEKLFAYYEIYWNKYVGAKLSDTEYDVEDLEQWELTTPNNIMTFAEYLVFGAVFPQGKNHIINKIISKNKHNEGFASFLKYYRNSRIVFFRIVNRGESEGTFIRDILTGKSFCLEDIDISHYADNEVFIAYFNEQNNLLPSITISIDLDDMQVLAFQDAVKKMCRYMLGKDASIDEFLVKYDLLARYLCMVSAKNKRIGVILKQLMLEQKVQYCSDQGIIDDEWTDKIKKITNNLYFTVEEQQKLLNFWRYVYIQVAFDPLFDTKASTYFMAAIKIFLNWNYPDDMVVGMMEVFEFDNSLVAEYEKKINDKIDLEHCKMLYMTEFGMIDFIDNLMDKE